MVSVARLPSYPVVNGGEMTYVPCVPAPADRDEAHPGQRPGGVGHPKDHEHPAPGVLSQAHERETECHGHCREDLSEVVAEMVGEHRGHREDQEEPRDHLPLDDRCQDPVEPHQAEHEQDEVVAFAPPPRLVEQRSKPPQRRREERTHEGIGGHADATVGEQCRERKVARVRITVDLERRDQVDEDQGSACEEHIDAVRRQTPRHGQES